MTNHFLLTTLTNNKHILLNMNNILYAERFKSNEHGNREITKITMLNSTEPVFVESLPIELYNQLVKLNNSELKEYNLPK